MSELISINLTTYNRSELLSRAIKSVLIQSYKVWELIIVDDGSTDNTISILKNFTKQNRRIKVIRHASNQGNAAARNTALAESRGKYVAFLDDDDEWIDGDKLKKQLKILRASPDTKLGLVCTSVNIISEKGTLPVIIKRPKNLKSFILSGNGRIYSPTVMTKREIMLQAGGFDTFIPRGIDSEFYRTCIVKFGYNVNFLPDITTNVYVNSSTRLTPFDSSTSLIKSLKANRKFDEAVMKEWSVTEVEGWPE